MERVEHFGEVETVHGDPVSVEITRGQRGGYGWTIKIYGKDPDKIIAQLSEIDHKLSAAVGGKVEGD